jgi:hypothetical protein
LRVETTCDDIPFLPADVVPTEARRVSGSDTTAVVELTHDFEGTEQRSEWTLVQDDQAAYRAACGG